MHSNHADYAQKDVDTLWVLSLQPKMLLGITHPQYIIPERDYAMKRGNNPNAVQNGNSLAFGSRQRICTHTVLRAHDNIELMYTEAEDASDFGRE